MHTFFRASFGHTDLLRTLTWKVDKVNIMIQGTRDPRGDVPSERLAFCGEQYAIVDSLQWYGQWNFLALWILKIFLLFFL